QSLAALSLPVANKIDKTAFELLMRLPKLRIVNINHAAPKLRFGEMLLPIAEMLAVKRRKLRRHPGLRMNTVRDIGDGNFVDRNARPYIFPKCSAHFTVQFADTIRVATKAQRQDCHAERLVGVESCVAE